MKIKISIPSIMLAACLFLITSSCTEEFIPEEPLVNADTRGIPKTKATTNFKFGVAGTALGSLAYYSVPYDKQMYLLKRMGMNIYKFQFITMADGSATVPAKFNAFIKAAKDHDITLLPMIYHKNLDMSVSNAESYARGYEVGRNVARQYKDLFTYYELGNELNLKCLIPGSAGKTSRSYDLEKFETVAAYLNGMNKGVKSEDPDAKTMINTGWLHYGYIEMLEDHGIDFDIIAYHWYSEMDGAAAKDFGIDDILDRLSSKFDKPIWFTEIGQRYKEVYNIEELQHSFISQFIDRCKAHPQVQAAIVFQLFDQPAKKDLWESNYGIFKWMDPYTKYAPKVTAQQFLRQVVQANR